MCLHYPTIFGFKSPTENLSKISRIAAEDFLLKMDVKSAYDNVNRECAISEFFREMKKLLGGENHLYLHHFKIVKESKIDCGFETNRSFQCGKFGKKQSNSKIFSIYLPFKVNNLDKITNYQQSYIEKITPRYSKNKFTLIHSISQPPAPKKPDSATSARFNFIINQWWCVMNTCNV